MELRNSLLKAAKWASFKMIIMVHRLLCQMDLSTQGRGLMAKSMAKASRFGLMDLSTTECGKMIKLTEMVF